MIAHKTSLTLDAGALDKVKALGINVSSVVDAALSRGVTGAKHAQWLKENEAVVKAQSDWYTRIATRLITSMQRVRLRRTGTLTDQGNAIKRAVDILMVDV